MAGWAAHRISFEQRVGDQAYRAQHLPHPTGSPSQQPLPNNGSLLFSESQIPHQTRWLRLCETTAVPEVEMRIINKIHLPQHNRPNALLHNHFVCFQSWRAKRTSPSGTRQPTWLRLRRCLLMPIQPARLGLYLPLAHLLLLLPFSSPGLSVTLLTSMAARSRRAQSGSQSSASLNPHQAGIKKLIPGQDPSHS
ncbi:hypothetical protein MPH_02933 [Macrophomina phaseolina MS6]|uniref:Uncharacterized protein n=1 Tax=Macrophomina phaseolina (strain MS6) TaxID=1126212 RepID=K2S432_MACPH|nr:hypothetical protein MPH_02933 [Macrophomina phaseolina MS6]